MRSRSGLPEKKQMLSAMEPAKSWSSCITTPIRARHRARPMRDSGSPSTRISPRVGCSRPASSFSSVVLPQPEGPAIATDSPASIRKLTPSSTQDSLLP
jgi:hypothetical protein